MDTVSTNRSGDELRHGLVAGAIGAVVLVVAGVLLGDQVPRVDAWATDVLVLEHGGQAEAVIAVASDGLRIAGVSAAVAALGWLLWRDRRRALAPALGYVFLFLVLTASSELLKEVFHRPHPTDPADWSFPSTHVAMVTVGVIVAAAAAMRAEGLAPRWRGSIVLLAGAAIAATAATRVLLGEHHLTDVAGTAFAYTGLGLMGVWWIALARPRADRPG